MGSSEPILAVEASSGPLSSRSWLILDLKLASLSPQIGPSELELAHLSPYWPVEAPSGPLLSWSWLILNLKLDSVTLRIGPSELELAYLSPKLARLSPYLARQYQVGQSEP